MTEHETQHGVGRVLEPRGSLPQAAQRLDPSLPIRPWEIAIDVDTLNIDSASFHQIVGEVGRSPEAIGARIREIVASRGKMQNPVTGSGGMLLGTVSEVGSSYRGPAGIAVGARVATLVSLTLTPLALESILGVHLDADQVRVRGRAILWSGAPLVRMPDDLPERVALSCLDVCGAPAQTARLAGPGKRIAVLGAGKSGLLCMAQARESLGASGRIVAVDVREDGMRRAAEAGWLDAWAVADATDPVAASGTIRELLGGEPADLVLHTANVPNAEMAAILAVRDGGVVYFFNMATSFARAALGAEGVGRDATLIIGNGYAEGHAELTLGLVRRHSALQEYFARLAGA